MMMIVMGMDIVCIVSVDSVLGMVMGRGRVNLALGGGMSATIMSSLAMRVHAGQGRAVEDERRHRDEHGARDEAA